MSLTFKRVVMIVLGLMGGCMVWPLLLTVQFYQMGFPGYFSFSLVQGMVFGMVFGAIFGSFEGIVLSSRAKAFKGLLFGALAGIASGALAVIAGQAALFQAADAAESAGQTLTGLSLVIASGTSWMIIGVCISMVEGFRSRSLRKILVGLAGGITGGVLGGVALQIILNRYPANEWALLAGLLVFSLSLSLGYTFFENRFSFGSVKILNGPLKNKEISLSRQKMSIGSSDSCDIVLSGYRDLLPLHANLFIKKGRVTIQAAAENASLKVNDTKTSEQALRREDVFAIGSAKCMYGIFS